MIEYVFGDIIFPGSRGRVEYTFGSPT